MRDILTHHQQFPNAVGRYLFIRSTVGLYTMDRFTHNSFFTQHFITHWTGYLILFSLHQKMLIYTHHTDNNLPRRTATTINRFDIYIFTIM